MFCPLPYTDKPAGSLQVALKHDDVLGCIETMIRPVAYLTNKDSP